MEGEKKRVILVGGFNKARSLATSLIKKGYNVTAINNDMQDCQNLAGVDKLRVFYGDGSKPYVLEDANACEADLAIALTGRDDDNLVICELCKKRFKVARTVAIISDPKKTEFFYRMGIDSVVSAISAITSIIEQQAVLDEIATLIPLGDGRIRVTQVPISENSNSRNKKLSELSLPSDVIIGCVLRGSDHIIPSGDTRIMAGDMVVLISFEETETAAVKELM